MSAYDRYQLQLERLQQGPDPDYAKRKAVASLFIDDNAMLEYLASERFPDDPGGAFRYQIIDGEIMYEDDQGNMRKEFERPGDVTAYGEYIQPNFAPAGTFAADMAGGIIGAGKGFAKGVELAKNSPAKHPLAMAAIVLGSTAVGGFGGTALAGGAARGTRALTASAFYNLPPEEIAASLRDLGVSSAFSAIPFGAGPTTNVVNKFLGKEDSLRYLYNLRQGVQGTIDEAAKMGIKLTPAEAASISTGSAHRAANIQLFLSKQPQLRKLSDFYESRASRAVTAINQFADSMIAGSGTQLKSAQERIAQASRDTIKELNRRRKDRASKLYDGLRDEATEVDLSPVLSRIDEMLLDPRLPSSTRQAVQEFRDSLMVKRQVKNPTTGKMEEIEEPLSDLMSIHDRRTTDMEAVVKANLGNANAGKIIGLREDVTALLDDANASYALARRVFDPTKPAIEAVENSAIGRLSGLFQAGNDKAVARSIKEIFNPDVSPRSLRNARRVLKVADPEGWQQIKKFYLNDQLDRFTREQALEGGVPNFQRHFAQPRIRNMMQEILDPQELENFYRLNDIMGAAFNTVRRGASDTQQFLRLEDDFAKEALSLGLGDRGIGFGLSILRSPGRIAFGQVGDELAARIARKQNEAYYDKMVDVLLSDDGAETIEDAYNVFSRIGYGVKQGGARGVVEGVDALGDPLIQNYEPTEQKSEEIMRDMERLNQIENEQSMVNPVLFDDLPETEVTAQVAPTPLSPSLLPSEEDREIAMRRQQGIAGLMV